jgi:hypothetical protein
MASTITLETQLPIELELDPDTEDEVAAEPMTEPFDPAKIHIIAKQQSLDTLIKRLENDEIDMNTDFQRHADLWNDGKMSRLIESILIRFPLPAFYFDASDDERWQIVDGLQRLSAIRKFVVKGELALTGLEFLKDLKGKRYDEIGRTFQRRIAELSVTIYLIGAGTPSNVKYSVFRRINTGGLTLNNQEIRHAMARPRERGFLNELSTDQHLIKTMGDQSKRMQSHELVLRFVAFLVQDYVRSPKNMARFLDDAMDRMKTMPDSELAGLEARFRGATRAAWELFGDTAFEKRVGTENGRRRKNSSLFEVWTVSLARLAESDPESVAKLIERRDEVQKRMQDLTRADPAFFQSISMATQKRDNVRMRFDKVEQLIKEVTGA